MFNQARRHIASDQIAVTWLCVSLPKVPTRLSQHGDFLVCKWNIPMSSRISARTPNTFVQLPNLAGAGTLF
jgi:hypothetical protein